jgi:hypothetical protein
MTMMMMLLLLVVLLLLMAGTTQPRNRIPPSKLRAGPRHRPSASRTCGGVTMLLGAARFRTTHTHRTSSPFTSFNLTVSSPTSPLAFLARKRVSGGNGGAPWILLEPNKKLQQQCLTHVQKLN